MAKVKISFRRVGREGYRRDRANGHQCAGIALMAFVRWQNSSGRKAKRSTGDAGYKVQAGHQQKVAKALGFIVPQTLQVAADEVIGKSGNGVSARERADTA